MKKQASVEAVNFEPELFCLRCDQMEWDEETRRCENFDGPRCPLFIRGLLAGIEVRCVVV